MLNKLFIFEASGKLLFSKNWKEEKTMEEDPVLISGFLSAIWMFASKIGVKGVRSIQTEKDVLVGISSPKYDLLFVLVANPNADIPACKHLLTRIRQSFLQKYKNHLIKGDFHSPKDFIDWLPYLENILESTDLAPVESVMKKFLKTIVDETKEKPEN